MIQIFIDLMKMNNLFEETPKFIDHINPVTLSFRDEHTEEEFYKYKYETKNLLLAIGIDIFFNMFILGLRTICVYFVKLNDLLPTNFDTSIYLLVQMILWNFALIIEVPIFFIRKLHLLRGFFLTSLPMAGGCALSVYLCRNAYNTNAAMLTNLSYFAAIESIIISIVYSANWICGSLQITILCIICSVSFVLMPGHPILDKPFLTILNFSISLGIILVLYYFEYFQRKAIFMKVEAEKQRNNLKLILDRIPEPILITVQSQIEYSNEAYSNVVIYGKEECLFESEEVKSQTSKELAFFESIDNQENLKREFLLKLRNTQTEKSLKETIENDFHYLMSNLISKSAMKIAYILRLLQSQ